MYAIPVVIKKPSTKVVFKVAKTVNAIVRIIGKFQLVELVKHYRFGLT